MLQRAHGTGVSSLGVSGSSSLTKSSVVSSRTVGSSGSLSGGSYDCRVCGKTFTSGWELRRHLHAHADSRPFKCPYCPHRCNFKHNLKTHIRCIHPGEMFLYTIGNENTNKE
ncbi:unnamed protein product, partial [Meganyctiphanes norvegica]